MAGTNLGISGLTSKHEFKVCTATAELGTIVVQGRQGVEVVGGGATLGHRVQFNGRFAVGAEAGDGTVASLALSGLAFAGRHGSLGGAVSFYGGGSLRVANCLFKTNAATARNGKGGAIYFLGTGRMAVEHSTFNNNMCDVGVTNGGAIYFGNEGGAKLHVVTSSFGGGNAASVGPAIESSNDRIPGCASNTGYDCTDVEANGAQPINL